MHYHITDVGAITDRLHDRQLAAINHSGLKQPACNYAYTTSPENRILGLTESVASTATETWGYGYDQADRLTDALVTPGGAYTYGLDAGDNLLTVQTPASSTTSTYDNLNQIDLRNAQPFVYDAAGNLLNDGQRTYAWDAEQRLIGIGYLATPAVSTILRYDGLGRRTAVKEYTNSNNYTETRYLWCGERICQARNASDAIIRRYYEEGELHVSSTGNTPYYYAQDHLGSVRDLVDASGKALASYDYDPYGQPTRATTNGSARADYRYAGLFYHAPSGLYLTHYRAYDPVTARWLSRDPIGERGGVNLYAYVEGDPINYTDPRGLYGQISLSELLMKNAVKNAMTSSMMSVGPFGRVCGSESNASWVPDGPWKEACQNHDDCYSICGVSRLVCDIKFLYDSNGNLLYFRGIRAGGENPYKEAQRASCCNQEK